MLITGYALGVMLGLHSYPMVCGFARRNALIFLMASLRWVTCLQHLLQAI